MGEKQNGDSDETSITLSKQAHRDVVDIKPDGINWSSFLKQAAGAWEEEYGDQWE